MFVNFTFLKSKSLKSWSDICINIIYNSKKKKKKTPENLRLYRNGKMNYSKTLRMLYSYVNNVSK